MGHYRSEMVSDKEINREEQQKREKREQRAAKIKAAINSEGIEYVLADIIENPTIASIRYSAS